MIRRHLQLVAAGACVLCVGCSTPTSPSAPALTLDALSGTWTLVALQAPGQPEVTPPAGATFGMQVMDGRVAVTADCNRCVGAAVVGTTTLTLGPAMACTRAFCASAPFDDVFLRILGGESTASIEGNTLILRSDRGAHRFRR
jgi:heat shock protein HslJ